MKTVIQQPQVLKRWDSLSDNIREALVSPQNADTLQRICEIEHISPEKMRTVSKVTGYALLGFIHPEEIGNQISEELNIDKKIGASIADAVQKRILAPLKPDLEKIYAPAEEEPVPLPTIATAPKRSEGPAVGPELNRRELVERPKIIEEIKKPPVPAAGATAVAPKTPTMPPPPPPPPPAGLATVPMPPPPPTTPRTYPSASPSTMSSGPNGSGSPPSAPTTSTTPIPPPLKRSEGLIESLGAEDSGRTPETLRVERPEFIEGSAPKILQKQSGVEPIKPKAGFLSSLSGKMFQDAAQKGEMGRVAAPQPSGLARITLGKVAETMKAAPSPSITHPSTPSTIPVPGTQNPEPNNTQRPTPSAAPRVVHYGQLNTTAPAPKRSGGPAVGPELNRREPVEGQTAPVPLQELLARATPPPPKTISSVPPATPATMRTTTTLPATPPLRPSTGSPSSPQTKPSPLTGGLSSVPAARPQIPVAPSPTKVTAPPPPPPRPQN